MIKQTSFKHGWFYIYKIHSKKISQMSKEFNSLKEYLNSMLTDCPHSYFEKGPRSSQTRLKFGDIKLHKIKGHEVCNLAEQALNQKTEQTRHTKVQTYFLQYDKKTIAVETPIWLNSTELNKYEDLFKTKYPLTGHIDLIRNEEGKIWVWDYKPDAEKEKFASTQVCLYAVMLSKRTNLPLEKFNCGYFDEKNAFIFKPIDINLPQKSLK